MTVKIQVSCKDISGTVDTDYRMCTFRTADVSFL
jgi:hypothetical protein